MKNLFKYGMMLLMGIMLWTACSEEEELTPTGGEKNWFAVQDNDKSAGAELRRAFYKETGVHLLFNDTIRKINLGKDGYGDDIWDIETIDFAYELTATKTLDLQINYLDNADYQVATDFLNKYVISRLEKGGSLFPYSILLTSLLEARDYSFYPYEPVKTVTSIRCLGISVGEVASMTDEERKTYAIDVLADLVASKTTGESDSRLASFYALTANCYYNYYGTMMQHYMEDLVSDWDRDLTKVYALGLLGYDEPYSYYISYDRVPTKIDDLKHFLKAVLSTTQKEFETTYADYPILIERYDILRKVVLEMGLKL